ncbi:DedA family protein [Azomonas macrocytogenes]|uniref:Membrane protein DedA with SNARE-associated domain n=1 Tax=Azomonas macrocytogenes TaxID=69962 RepID=A0A839TBD9_AZOMA|nr:DedA family protein [Azomonas macrocytogenes]MBB3104923.1 membrane protein DedA with SNARE-associated domain [Azomonas macrocytogenes]
MFDSLVEVVNEMGYVGIIFLMFMENLFPPIPSEVIMPLAGFSAANGDLHIILVILSGTFGSVLGALPWYYAGVYFGEERMLRLAKRYGRWMTISCDDVSNASSWFSKHGRKAVFFGRMIPAIRTLISVPAGIARMPFLPFLAYSALGSMLWTSLLTILGYILHTEYAKVADYVDPFSKIVLGTIIGIYIYRLFFVKRNDSIKPPSK